MTSYLKPVSAVNCPSLKGVVPITDCSKCECMEEIRRPWRHYAVQCNFGDENEAVYQ